MLGRNVLYFMSKVLSVKVNEICTGFISCLQNVKAWTLGAWKKKRKRSTEVNDDVAP